MKPLLFFTVVFLSPNYAEPVGQADALQPSSFASGVAPPRPLTAALDFSMLRTSPFEQNYRRASAVVFLVGIASAWIAIWSLRSYPSIYIPPKDEEFGFAPLFIGALVLLPIAFPIATSIFNPSKIVFALAVALSLPLFFFAGRDLGNVYFDNSEAKTVIATITAKRESGGWKTHDYFLQIIPQGASVAYEFAVPYPYFQASSEGQSIAVHVHSGFLGQPWVSSYGNPQEI